MAGGLSIGDAAILSRKTGVEIAFFAK